MKRALLYILISSCLIYSCESGNQTQVESEPQQTSDNFNMFGNEQVVEDNILVSKGIIKSENEVFVFSRLTGQLNEVTLIDGQKVSKGQVLFTLDQEEYSAKLDLAKAELEQAELLMEDILIGQGYKKSEFKNVSQAILRTAKIKSGCDVKEKEIEIAENKLEHTKIKAPISGVVANITLNSYSFVNPGETLCTIVDTNHLIVEFSILETELKRFLIGGTIKVSPIAYSDQTYLATIRSIGSIVDDAGMIKVEATINDNSNLMPGMTAIIKL